VSLVEHLGWPVYCSKRHFKCQTGGFWHLENQLVTMSHKSIRAITNQVSKQVKIINSGFLSVLLLFSSRNSWCKQTYLKIGRLFVTHLFLIDMRPYVSYESVFWNFEIFLSYIIRTRKDYLLINGSLILIFHLSTYGKAFSATFSLELSFHFSVT
jgi:hypothetical protein